MDAILKRAFDLPAAILIRDDLLHFADATNVGYVIGVQQPRQHRRFANFFRNGDSFVLYFKHDVAEVDELYQRFSQVILPSEVTTKYWSKVLVSAEPLLAERLLDTSYRLICEAITKEGRKMIEQCGAEPNQFFTFHQAALELSYSENVFLRYTDYQEPCLSVGIRPVAKFSWNRLSVRLPIHSGIQEHWTALEPQQSQEWQEAMQSAVQAAT